MSKRLTSIEFIEKAKTIHGDKYDYSKVEYKNSKNKVDIVCQKHGVFKQTSSNHIKSGCPKCKKEETSIRITYSLKEFIGKAASVHGERYDYSLVEYVGSQVKVRIICHEHSIFWQMPYHHLQGKGCPKCAGNIMSSDEFAVKALEVHGGKYDYLLVKYKNSKTKVDIICQKHGIFKQTPDAHMSGQGCPRCRDSKGEEKIAKFLDISGITYMREYRFNDCRNINPLPVDFYIPSLNLAIEYDGEQHFNERSFGNGERGLKYIQSNDSIKTNYCFSNGINLLRISYHEDIDEVMRSVLINENVVELLKEEKL